MRKQKTLEEILQAERERNSAAQAIKNLTAKEIFESNWNKKFYERNTVVYVNGMKRTITPEQHAELSAMLVNPPAPENQTMANKVNWFLREYEGQLDGSGFQS